MIRSAVDLPQPEGPSRLRNSPRPTVSDMSRQRERAVGKDFRDMAHASTTALARAGGDRCGKVIDGNDVGQIRLWMSAPRPQRARPCATQAGSALPYLHEVHADLLHTNLVV